MQAYLDRLEAIENDVMSLRITMAGLQRVWFDLLAGLDYAEVYQPIMNGEARDIDAMPRVMGAYTTELHVVEMFMSTPIPIFFIRPLTSFSNQIILRAVELVKPPSQIFPSPRLSVVYSGPPTSTEKIDAMLKFLATFLTYKDPFKTEPSSHGSQGSRKPSSGPTRSKKTKADRSKPQYPSQNKKRVNPPSKFHIKFILII